MVVGRKPNIRALVQQGLIPAQRTSVVGTNSIDWTAEKKAIVFNMLKWGIPIEDVAVTVGCAVRTLQTYCKPEILHARIHANVSVAEVFYKMAVSGKIPAATMHWMKTRVKGFKDTIEHSGEVHVTASAIDPRKLTTEQLRALEAIHASGALEQTGDTIDIEPDR